MRYSPFGFALLPCVFVAAFALAENTDGPVAHWKLDGNTNDSGHRFDATNHGVTFETSKGKGASSPSGMATFDGKQSYLEVKPDARLCPGTGDFTLSLRINTGTSPSDTGDLISMYDEVKRVGFHLALRTNPGTTGTANVRQLQFGMDAGSDPQWADEGRPGSAVLGFAFTVHDGRLYTGTADNGEGKVGRVYRYVRKGEWADCGAPDQCNAVTSLVTYKGHLYAATGKYRFGGSALTESENTHTGGGVYRYEGETCWKEVGRLPNVLAVAGMVEFRGKLYASSLYKPAGFFRYEADGKWTSLPTPDGKRIESLAVFEDALWATSYDDARVYRYDGTRWEDLGRLGENTQTYAFTIYRNQLYVGTWPSGKVYRRLNDRWEDVGRLGEETEVMGLLVHNGHLYGGTLPLAEVYRFDGGQTWTRTTQLDTTPNVRFRRVWTMASFQGRLFCTTLPSGKIHSLITGPCVTCDRELPPGRQHIVAVKQGGLLRLFVNGKQVAESHRFDPARFNLVNQAPLRIGAGSGGNFRGSVSDVRLYHRALSEAEINAIGKN